MSSNKPNFFALLVAIDQYHPDSSVTPLKGCVNDINASKTLLKTNYQVPDSHICRLTNEQATHQNIVDHFKSHLIANSSPNTILLFWFSGHGSRQRTDPRFYKYLPEDDEREKKDETLVCYDSRVKINGEMPNADLADKELAVLIDWAAQKGADVVTVFDSCHSGDITRSDPDNYERTRLVEDRAPEEESSRADGKSHNKPFSRSYLGGHYQKHKLNNAPKGKHLKLAACQYYETAKECVIEGNKRGVFSYYLQQTIAQNPTITYPNLFEQIRSHISQRTFSSPQTPQYTAYEGFDAHQMVFSQQKPKHLSNKYEVRYDEDKEEWRVKHGAQQGLPTSGKVIGFDIYNSPTDQVPMNEAYVKTVEANSSTLVLEHKLSPHQTYWGVLTYLEDVPLYVKIESDDSAKQQALETFINLQNTTFFAIDNSKTREFKVVLKQGRWQLFRGKETTPLVDESFDQLNIFNKLNLLGRWHLLRNNQNKNTKFEIPKFKIKVEDLTTNKKIEGKKVFQQKRMVCSPNKNGEWVFDAEITGQNYRDEALYFALLYFNDDYSIEIPYNKQINASKPFVIDSNEFVIETGDTANECIQIMISTEKIDTHFLSQAAITSDQDFRKMRKKEKVADWCTVTMELNLAKK